MALTIEQIQTNITNKMDARLIINQMADYIQANPGGGGGGVESVTGDMVNNDDALNPVISISDAPFADSIGGNEFIGIIQDDEFKNTTIQSIIDLVQPPVPNIEQVLTAGDNANGLNIAKVGTLGIGNLESLPTNSLFNISDGLGTGSNMINASFNSGTNKSIVTVGATGAEGQDYAYLQLRNDSGSEFYLYADDGYFRGAAGESPTIAWWDVTEFKFNVPLRLTSVQEFADNAAAVTGGLTAGMVYRTGDVLKIVHA